jgi:site-specific recombinase XerD
MITLGSLIVSFFSNYLAKQKGCRENTICSYSDCIRLLLSYACEKLSVTFDKLDLELLTDLLILDFLDHLEQRRGNKAKTRNHRLAVIKTFFRFLALHDPKLTAVCERVCAISPKNTEHKVIATLEKTEVVQILAGTQSDTLLGARDQALLTMLYNTGARAQELADLDVSDVRMDKPLQVLLTGKGRRQRVVPLYEESVTAIKHYLKLREREGITSSALFVNVNGVRITRFGIAYIISKYAALAAHRLPSLWKKRVTPHTYRHTTALHLIQSGCDISVVKEWLGHADLKTTSLYLEIDIDMKRKALEACPSPASCQTKNPVQPIWGTPDILSFLQGLSRKSHYVERNSCRT